MPLYCSVPELFLPHNHHTILICHPIAHSFIKAMRAICILTQVISLVMPFLNHTAMHILSLKNQVFMHIQGVLKCVTVSKNLVAGEDLN